MFTGRIGCLEVWKDKDTRTPLTVEGGMRRAPHPLFPSLPNSKQNKSSSLCPQAKGDSLFHPPQPSPDKVHLCRRKLTCQEVYRWLPVQRAHGMSQGRGGCWVVGRGGKFFKNLKGLAKRHWRLFPYLGPCFGELWGYN